MDKGSELEKKIKISSKNGANFFAEGELREKGAVDSKEYPGGLVLNNKLYIPRADYYLECD